MRRLSGILGLVLLLAGIIAAAPEELFLVYVHIDPLGFLGAFRQHPWRMELLGLVLIVAALCLTLPSIQRLARRSRLRDE
jgi:hypothetical protein